ncbi:nucleotide sugar dehydrogenase [Govanella unica]|uniref:Nucleotide sugar dehydrogenase n=1 Tax=Govanella unica TaxID=2975056 RepID=A0A9X3TXB5_9PROT|nr:nucleotide sugar dehydrogenase [Govania unica]MDA5193392.1 nucleotide sugar dehydrogenase [Govania unica]
MTAAHLSPDTKVAVIGLGYVGLPLAVALAKHFKTTGLDINARRIDELRKGIDRTEEVEPEKLKASSLHVTSSADEIKDFDIFVVTVPTPVDEHNKPDLSPVRGATNMIAPLLKKGAIVVYESTVYPGVTEEVCGPLLEKGSGLKCGKDFFLGYSPERINPGDREHTVDRITKVIAGQTPAVTETLAGLYGAVTTGGVFRAANIRAAEAAKVIENAQRDINIAFVNEVTMIFQKLGISVYDVLDAAGTKWNFLNFKPGLVGGHCIGVDPFYLAERAKQINHDPAIILSGRKINDGMGDFIAERITAQVQGGGRMLVLGLTFKENVPDLRNSKVIDVIRGLERRGFRVDVHDPMADVDEAQHEYGVDLKTGTLGDVVAAAQEDGGYDGVVAAVTHNDYAALTPSEIVALVKPGGIIADIKGMWRGLKLPEGVRRWTL